MSEPVGPPAGSLDRGSVVNSATNSGVRDFETPDNYQPTPAQGQGQGQPQRPTLPTPTDPNQAVGANAGLPANFQSIRDAAREYGHQFGPEVTDDRQALAALVQQAQANQYYAQMGQRLAPHAQGIQQYLQQKNTPAPAAPAERQPWEAPPFDRRWESLVIQDERTGLYLSKQGVDPAIGKAVNEYVEWKEGFDADPAGVINGMVKAQAREEAMSIYREQNAIQQEQNTARSIVDRNAEWFYAKGQDGRRIYDFQGRAQPTPLGASYLRHLGTVKQAGVSNAAMQDHLAMQLLRGEYAAANYGRQQQVSQANGLPAQQATQQPNTNPLQNLPPQQRAITRGATQPGEEGLSLFERLQRNFAAGNVTDRDFLAENIAG